MRYQTWTLIKRGKLRIIRQEPASKYKLQDDIVGVRFQLSQREAINKAIEMMEAGGKLDRNVPGCTDFYRRFDRELEARRENKSAAELLAKEEEKEEPEPCLATTPETNGKGLKALTVWAVGFPCDARLMQVHVDPDLALEALEQAGLEKMQIKSFEFKIDPALLPDVEEA